MLAIVVALICAVPSFAQLELYAASHLFALPTATTTRLFGMGGFVTCIPDVGFGNPAFAAMLDDTSAVARHSITDFSGGLSLNGSQASIAVPLSRNHSGIQITGFQLESDAGGISIPLAPPLNVDYSEYELSIHYGQRLGSRLALGVGMSPTFHNSLAVTDPATGMPLADLNSEADQGFRAGATYEIDDLTCFGLVYDRYKEDVTASGVLFGPSPIQAQFTSEEMLVGISRQVSDRVLAAIEWQQITTEGAGADVGDSGFRFGFEATAGDKTRVRMGMNDGALSCGLGYSNANLTANYAYIQNWNRDSVSSVFGDSDTHQIELTYTW